MNKKTEEKRRTRNIGIRLTNEEFAALADNAEGAGMSISDYVRHAIHGDDINVTYTMQASFPDVTDAVREMSTKMANIANNLNQIARWTNGGGSIAEKTYDYIVKAQQDIGNIRKEITGLEAVVNSEFKTFSEEGMKHGNNKA